MMILTPLKIMMGVHGNGLTSLVWMKPTPKSTVMEFFYPGGFAHDYEYTTRALGMVHYGFWGNTCVISFHTSPYGRLTAYIALSQGQTFLLLHILKDFRVIVSL